MTREDAIEYWQGLRKTFSSQLEKEENHFGRMHLQTTIDAIDMAISALRAQQEQQPNAPLTLDEMREMDGYPVWVVCLRPERYYEPPIGWRIIEKSIVDTFGVWNESSCLAERDYGKTWLAFRQKPEEDDRES